MRFPGAIKPVGRYEISGELVRVAVALKRDGQTIRTVELSGQKNDIRTLAAELAAAIERNDAGL
ncbi:MAG TPA: hypothetical protein V6D17_14675 [Candidatus Obscuribacterales bacterium]